MYTVLSVILQVKNLFGLVIVMILGISRSTTQEMRLYTAENNHTKMVLFF